jgi:hypothetical protein
MGKKKQKKDKKRIKAKYADIIEKLKMLQITNNAIQEGIINLMKGKEEYKDLTRVGDLIYSGSVFQTILEESYDENMKPQLSEKILEQLTELIVLSYNYAYVMVIDND